MPYLDPSNSIQKLNEDFAIVVIIWFNVTICPELFITDCLCL